MDGSQVKLDEFLFIDKSLLMDENLFIDGINFG